MSCLTVRRYEVYSAVTYPCYFTPFILKILGLGRSGDKPFLTNDGVCYWLIYICTTGFRWDKTAMTLQMINSRTFWRIKITELYEKSYYPNETWWSMTAWMERVSICLRNGLPPVRNKPLPEPMMTNCPLGCQKINISEKSFNFFFRI